MSYDWYPFYPVDWKRDTLHLTLAEEGAYRRLNDEYMVSGGGLPDNDAALARLIGVSLTDWMAVAPTIRKFYEASNGKLIHKRCEEELLEQLKQSHSKRMAGALGAETRWKGHQKKQNKSNKLLQAHSTAMAIPMRNDATLHNNTKESSSDAVAALARSPDGELRAASPKLTTTDLATKRPSEVSRSELESRFAARRAAP